MAIHLRLILSVCVRVTVTTTVNANQALFATSVIAFKQFLDVLEEKMTAAKPTIVFIHKVLDQLQDQLHWSPQDQR